MTEDQATAEVKEQDADLIDSWLEEATPDEVRVPICMNRKLLAEFDALIAEIGMQRPDVPTLQPEMMDEDEKGDEDPELTAIHNRLIELKNLIEKDERDHTFVFRKCPRKVWRKILTDHPPTKEQTERYRGFIDHNPDTAAVHMVAQSCVIPKMDHKQAERLQEALPENVFALLMNAAIRVNRSGTEIPKSVMRTVDRIDSSQKLTLLASEESL